jgi:hypothetical protein
MFITYADFVGLMSLLPNISIPQGMETATAQMFARVERDQRVHRVPGLFPSEFAFIHRRTGTHYVYNPELALFIADVPQNDTTLFAYVDMATLEPWEEAGSRVPGPPLSDLQLLLPTDVAGYPATESMNRQTPFYGHSEVWSTIRAWPPGYRVLRNQMARSGLRIDVRPPADTHTVGVPRDRWQELGGTRRQCEPSATSIAHADARQHRNWSPVASAVST